MPLTGAPAWVITQTVNSAASVSVVTGASLTFVVTVRNDDTITRSTSVSFPLSSFYVFGSYVSTGTYSSSTGVWTVNNLAAGSSVTLTVYVTVSASAAGNLITNKANIIFPDPAVQEISASTTVSVPTADWIATVSGGTYTTSEDTPLNNQPLTFAPLELSVRLPYVSVKPLFGTVSISSTGAFTYTPNPNYYGTDSFKFKLCLITNTMDCGKVSIGGAYAEATVSITVTPVSDLPVAVADAITITEDTATDLPLFLNDYDWDNLKLDGTAGTIGASYRITIVSMPTSGTAIIKDAAGGVVTYTPNSNYYGSDSLSYKICNTDATPICSNTVTVSLTVTPVTDIPNVVVDFASTGKNYPIDIAVWKNDINYDVLSAPTGSFSAAVWIPVIVTSPASGTSTVSSTTGLVTYTPNTDFVGSDSLSYKLCFVTAMTTCSSSTTVTITVTNFFAVNDAFTFDQNTGAHTLTVLVNDNLNGLTATQVSLIVYSAPAHASSITASGSTISYTSVPTYSGVDSFTYQFCKYVASNDGETYPIGLVPLHQNAVM